MEVTLEQLLTGKSLQIKGKDFCPTKSYVEPFLERVSKITQDIKVQVKLPDQFTFNLQNGERQEDTSYTRVLVQATLPDTGDDFRDVVGMVFGLDVRKPLLKIYKGLVNREGSNLCMFDPNFLNVQFIEPGKALSYKPIETLLSRQDDSRLMIQQLKDTEWESSVKNLETNLGRWIRAAISSEYDMGYGKIKIGTDTVIKAYGSMFVDKDSPYYIGEGNNVDMFTVYNSFTQILQDNISKDMMNYCEKTLLLRQILNF